MQRRSREDKGISNNMGLTIHPPPRSPTHQTVNPQGTATSWKVYSRARWCRKQMKECRDSLEAQRHGPLTQKTTCQQQQNTNLILQQQSRVSNEGFTHNQDLNGFSGNSKHQDAGEKTCSGENSKARSINHLGISKPVGGNRCGRPGEDGGQIYGNGGER